MKPKQVKIWIQTWFVSFLLICCITGFSTGKAYSEPALKALIVDGQNNHNWQACTPVLKAILEMSELFSVDVATSPAQGEPMDSYRPQFDRYNVIVLNYAGDDWPQETQKSFIDYVQNGGGVVVFHAANNSFPNWKEFNEITGLGGWGGRDEKSGPKVRYRDGQIVFDDSPGSGGTHGPQHEYEVTIRDLDHPITKGLPEVWMHAKDELYANLRGPAKNLHVLATSLSETTNENEPMLFTIQYGQGRVFHTVLGDNPYAMSCGGFVFTLQRGAEWAATGQVTQNKVPDSFPTTKEVRFCLRPIAWDSIKSYQTGQSRKVLSDVEENIRTASSSQLKQIEANLLEILKAGDATFEAKQFVCQMLRRMGSEESLPVLEPLLRDTTLSNLARLALQGLPSPKVNEVLRHSLADLQGDLRIGVIGTLAQRRDHEAVPVISPWITQEDFALSRTVIVALGEIGGTEAADVLSKAEVVPELQSVRNDSLLLCADKMITEGQIDSARAIYTRMTDKQYPSMTRLAAYRGLIALDAENAVSLMVSLLRDEDIQLRQAATGSFLRMIPGSKVLQSLMDEFSGLDPETQSAILIAFAARKDKSVVPAVVKAASSENENVKIAAIEALGILGDSTCVAFLAETALQGGKIGDASENSLHQMQNIDMALQRLLKSGEVKLQPVLLRSLITRRAENALPLLLEFALNAEAGVRQVAINGLTQISKIEDVPSILKLINSLNNQDDIQAVEEAVSTVAKEMADANLRTEYFLSSLQGASTSLRVSILRLLTRFGGEKACGAIEFALSDSNQDVQVTAFHSLVNWPDASPIDLLMFTAKDPSNPEKRAQALKGYIRMIDLVQGDSIEQTIHRYQIAMRLATNMEEKQMVLDAASHRTSAAMLGFLERFLSDSSLGKTALQGYQEIVKRLEASDADRKGWAVSASHNSDRASNAIDKNKDSRWDSGTSQVPGMWYQIDLKTERVVEKISLDTTGSNGDYPRKFEVYTSFDGNNWGSSVAEGVGERPVTVISIPSKSARFVKIVQTGSVEGTYWSIHDLTMVISTNKEELQHAYDVLKKYENQ